MRSALFLLPRKEPDRPAQAQFVRVDPPTPPLPFAHEYTIPFFSRRARWSLVGCFALCRGQWNRSSHAQIAWLQWGLPPVCKQYLRLRMMTPPFEIPSLKAFAALTALQSPTTENATMSDKTFVAEIEKVLEKSKGLNLSELLVSYQGTLYPTTVCSAETFQALENFESRKDDLVLVSYPKCGINWLIQILNDLIATTLKTKHENTELPFIECGDPEKYQRMKQFPSPRIVATHLHYNNIPKSIFKNKAKVMVLFRNPKDAAASFFYFHNNAPGIPSYNSWAEFFSEFMNGQVAWGSYFDQAVTWNKHIDDENVLILTYEELKEDLVAGVKQIAEFFGFAATAEQIKSIAGRAAFQVVLAKSQETHGAAGPLLFRKGVVGDWKNLFDEVQNQAMEAKFKECLAGTKLGAKLKYDVYCKA